MHKTKSYHNYADCKDPFACRYRMHILRPITKKSQESEDTSIPEKSTQLNDLQGEQKVDEQKVDQQGQHSASHLQSPPSETK